MDFLKVEEELNDLFNIKCPPNPNGIMTNKKEILLEFKNWYEFWTSQITNFNNPQNISNVIIWKNQICECKIIAIYQELKKHKLLDDFNEYMKK